MNRRRFLQSFSGAVAAAFTVPAVPALSLKPAAAALPAASPGAAAPAMATKARFWAIYMSGVQGTCSPATLSTVLNIPEAEARNYVTRLVADGVIKPHPLLQKATAKAAKLVEKKVWRRDEGLLDKMEEYVGWQWEDEVVEEEIVSTTSEEASTVADDLIDKTEVENYSECASEESVGTGI